MLQTLRQFLKEVFRQANTGKYTSIAIPAVGTGNLLVPHALVAKWMYDEAEEFSRKNPNTTLRDVRFVVYDRDAKTVAVTAVAISVFLNHLTTKYVVISKQNDNCLEWWRLCSIIL